MAVNPPEKNPSAGATSVNGRPSSRYEASLLTRTARKNRNELESQVFVWQGFLFNGNLVPTFGYRKDKARAFTVTAPNSPNGYVDQNAPGYRLPDRPNSVVEGSTRSYSVVGHAPRFLRDRL